MPLGRGPYLVDACQAVGQIPIDVGTIGCDYLAATSRKFLRGPRGVGFLYASDRVLAAGAHPLLVDMHGADWVDPDRFELTPDARRFELWEISSALVLGVGAAARYALGVGIETARDRARALAAYARVRLAELPGVRVLDRGADLCAIVTVEPAGRPATELKLALRARGINTSSPGREDAVIDMDEKQAASALRISPHYYNTAAEIDAAVGTWGRCCGGKRPAIGGRTVGPKFRKALTACPPDLPPARPRDRLPASPPATPSPPAFAVLLPSGEWRRPG